MNVTSLLCQTNIPFEQGDKETDTHIIGSLSNSTSSWMGNDAVVADVCVCGPSADSGLQGLTVPYGQAER